MNAKVLAALLIAVSWCPRTFGGGGPFGIDHRWAFDQSGIWSRATQNALIYGLMGLDVATAAWNGNEDRLGKTAWSGVDSAVIAGGSAIILKRATGRVRPTYTDDPDQWFKGGGNQSFPSGEVAVVSSIVTPFVLEYGREHPLVYTLELLPLYDGIARIKSRAHWQSDVIAAFAIGTAAGFYAHSRSTPFTLSILPGGFAVGLSKRF
jgi:undecaprenyl-diphosphatase